MSNKNLVGQNLEKSILDRASWFFSFGLFGIVLLLVLPIAPSFMDLLLAVSIGFSLIVLLIVVYLKDPAEFTIFPTLLLTVTIYRLGLNVASTRLILLDGYAGNVIDSFGNFVVRGNYVVGAVVFLILVVINFLVITKGSERIAEVAARFTLDSLPGKQMAIDAELNAGLIDEKKATQRRTKVQSEADFYGAMDGSSKFVRGDAIAGLLITVINVIGGIAIGVLQKGIPLVEALKKYTLLSIGDGLVSQVPALIVSLGAGVLITRSSENKNLGENLGRQILTYPKAIQIAAIMMFIFSVIPSMPFPPFFLLGTFLFAVSYALKKSGLSEKLQKEAFENELLKREGQENQEASETNHEDQNKLDLDSIVKSEVFTVEIGYGLLSFTNQKVNGDLIERVRGTRKKLAEELGFLMPTIAVKDSVDLQSNEYRFLLRGKQVASHTLDPHRWLAMQVDENDVIDQIVGQETIEPVFGLKAFWIEEKEKEQAELNGFTVVDSCSVLITHLTEILKKYSHDLLEREDTQILINSIKDKNPTLVSELFPDLVTVGLVQRVCKNLLKEGIYLKNLTLILETIGDYATHTKHPDDLSEQARVRLGPFFIEQYLNDGNLTAITLDPKLEQLLASQVKRTNFEVLLFVDPQTTQSILNQIAPLIEKLEQEGIEPVVLVTSEVRLAFKRFFLPSFPNLNVIAYQELPQDIKVKNFGTVLLQQKMDVALNNSN